MEQDELGAGGERARIVVGVDPSAEAAAALRWAARYAEQFGATLEVVHAWDLRHEFAWLQTMPPPAQPTGVAREALARVVEEVVGPGSRLDVTTDVVEGRPAKVLAERAKGAALLVVGHHGAGALDSLLLGSVAAACIAHAPCTVVVVRPEEG